MDKTRFASWRYRHGQPISFSPSQHRHLLIGLGITLLAWLAVSHAAAYVLAFLIAVYAVKIWPPGDRLLLGPRYLLCGNTLVYYANIRCCSLQPGPELHIHSGEHDLLVLKRDHFPSNARKAEKIARNQQAKFDKVCTRLREKVRAANPAVILDGWPDNGGGAS